MNLSEFAVKRYQFTLVVFAMLAALGVSALFTIPKAEDPTFPIPGFAIVAVLPGASPSDIERLVVDPVEAKLQTLDDIKHIKTVIDDSVAQVQVEFVAGVDADRKRDEVFREMTSLRPELPAELARFETFQFNAKDVNILQVALVSENASYDVLESQAQALKRRLQTAKGVGKVEMSGIPPQEVQVALDIERMTALRISPLEVLQAINSESANIPAGSVDAGTRRFAVKTSGDYQSLEELESTPIRGGAGASVRVRDVATVILGNSDATRFSRLNGQRAVFVAATQKEGQNIFEVREALQQALDTFRADLAPGVTLQLAFDQTGNVRHRLAGFVRDFAIAILLVLVTLLPLGLRAAGVVMISIPLSLAVGLSLLKAAGYSINQLSIVGFVIALGLLVDDSVVVVENIARFLRMGYKPREAAIEATRQITLSVLGCTATLIFAFLPLLALPGTAGQFIRSMPMAVVFTIGASLLVSLTIVPFLASVFLKNEGEHGNKVFQGMQWVIEGSYRRLLERSIARPGATLVVAGLMFVGSLALVPAIGFSLFPKAGTPQFLVNIQTHASASLAETDRATRFVEDTLKAHGGMRFVASTVGDGNPFIYYNLSPSNEQASVAEVFAEVEHFDAVKTPVLLDTIRRELATYPGAKIELKEFENGPPIDAPIAIRLLGSDQEALRQAAATVEDTMKLVTGTRDVRNPSRDERADLRVVIDREKAALFGVQPADVDRAVRLGVGGLVGGKFRAPGKEEAYDIRLAYARGNESASLDELQRVYVSPSRSQVPVAIPLSQVASIALQPSPTKLNHYNKERSATVTSQVATGFNTDRVTQEVLAALAKKSLPKGVRWVAAGEIESRQESFGGLGTAILIAVFGVLAVLVLEFQTFKSTLIVASVIPLGVVGGLVALFLSGNTLSFTATIGFVALMGIEVKNSILLVDFTNQLREQGMGLDEAIQKAGEIRFVPILLTTLTAVGGLIPLVLEHSPLYSPLALVILGGLISSTLLTRVVTPVMYKLLAPEITVVEEAPRALQKVA